MSSRVKGISRTSLWTAWKAVRRELRHNTLRDAVDHLEYDVDPEVWIRRLLRQIEQGSYEPATPARITLAKSKGFSRTLTVPAIPDLVLYRTIVDHLYQRARRREKRHVYFEVKKLSQATAKAGEEAKKDMQYATSSRRRFLAWLHYDQYRKYLIFKRIHPYIVVTDISNYFDSVLHGRLSEAFHAIAAPPGMLGLLSFLLERLSIRDAYGDSPAIGLPVDEFDCSRRLAHVFLFPHDDRMCDLVGDHAYIRWMDDQNLGAASRARALEILAELGSSLSRLHLTPNAGKTQILSLSEARRHFHLDLNKHLDKIGKMPMRTGAGRRAARRELDRFWRGAAKHEDQGEWSKVLKRAYRLAGLTRSGIFRRRAKDHLLQRPGLARRIGDYMRCSGNASSYLSFVGSVWSDAEQIYPDVNLTLLETLLRLEAPPSLRSRVRKIASDILAGRWDHNGSSQAGAIAPLLILRFGDRRSLPLLRRCFESRVDELPAETVRAAAIVYASYGSAEFQTVRRAAARIHRNPLAEVIRLVERIRDYSDVPASYKARLNPHYDAVAGRPYLDMRSLVAARLLKLNGKAPTRNFLDAKKEEWRKAGVSPFDRKLMAALVF